MPLDNDLNKVLIIGSGPTLIGSVSETDILISDAIKALVEDDIQVVLVNPNPATVSTDKKPKVTTYLEPMTLDFLKRIIRMEEPSAIISAYGSTMGIKVTRELVSDGILSQMGIRLLTINEQTLQVNTEEKMTAFLTKNGISASRYLKLSGLTANEIEKQLTEHVNYPVLLIKEKPYLDDKKMLFDNAQDIADYLKEERQNEDFPENRYYLTEDLSNWEEIILNIIRDSNGNVLFTSLADNIEPVSIDSGDSAAVMPALTLNNDQVQTLRKIAKKIAANLNVVGILNIHFAVKHDGTNFAVRVLSIKPRLTRSAIWSQRIGLYSLGYVVCKVAIGYHLNEITDPMSGLNAAIEPAQDKIAIRLPFWSLTQSGTNHYHLGSQMQASGEAIGIGQNFESAFLKGLASTVNVKIAINEFRKEIAKSDEDIIEDLLHPDELHLIKLLAAISKGFTYQDLQKIISIHPVYYQKFEHLAHLGRQLAEEEVTDDLLIEAKKRGFRNLLISDLTGISLKEVEKRIKRLQLKPAYLQIDGSAGVYEPKVHAFYSAFGVQDESIQLDSKKKILIVGMLPSQVSVTSEFDYMVSHAIDTLHNNKYDTVIISNNDESVATSYQKADKVYFEPITVENIVHIAEKEGIKEVLLQFSGKEISGLAKRLMNNGLSILGTGNVNPKDRIEQVLNSSLDSLRQTQMITTLDQKAGEKFIEENDFPLLIGGFNSQGVKQKSAVVYDKPALEKYLNENQLSKISLSHFIEGNKYEITAISDGENVAIPGIIEHLEQSGSHASDSIAVFKPQNLSTRDQKRLTEYTTNLIKQIKLRGIFTLHFLIVKDNVYLLQIKPYAGHNVAFLTQALGKDITACATEVLTGKNLNELDYERGLWHSNNFIYVKMPVFSYIDYHSENTFDSKMKSSGSVMGRDTALSKALYKGYEASGIHIPSFGTIFMSVRDADKKKMTELAKRFYQLGFKIIATEGTANCLAEAGITTGVVSKIHSDSNSLLDKIRQRKIVMVINITDLSDSASGDATRIRDEALNIHIPVLSSIETTELILRVLESLSLTTQPI